MSQQAVSHKNTKSEILIAYEDLLKEVGQSKKCDIKTQKAQERSQQVVETATNLVPETLVKNLTDLKLQLSKTLDDISEKLVNESRKLEHIQQAIKIENKNLQEKYEINTTADTLDALLLAQDRKRSEFDNEMTVKQTKWTEDQKVFEQTRTEQEGLWKKDRKRNEEEYTYRIERERKVELDEYEEHNANLNRELELSREIFDQECKVREQALQARESELLDLRSTVAEFDQKLEDTTQEVSQRTQERVEMKYKYQNELAAQEMVAERKLHAQVVQSLEAKVKEYGARIQLLNEQANQSTAQVQEVALKAIEGAATGRGFASTFDRQFKTEKVED